MATSRVKLLVVGTPPVVAHGPPDSALLLSSSCRYGSTKKKLGIVDVEVAIGRLLRMGSTDEGRVAYVSKLPEAERDPFDAFCRERVARHDEALSMTRVTVSTFAFRRYECPHTMSTIVALQSLQS